MEEPKTQEHDVPGSRLSDFREAKDFYTGKASDVNRTLAFGGIAVVWMFRNNQGQFLSGTGIIPDELEWPLILFIIALGLDLVQYTLASIIWTIFYHRHEKKVHEGKEADGVILASRWNMRTINLIFWAKIVITIVAFCLLLSKLLGLR